jgi:UDP-2,3-diacylglucosamine hydrolase
MNSYGDKSKPKPVNLRPHKYFIADLHLDGSASPRALKFREFLYRLQQEAALRNTELYILGDLFEFWYEYHAQLFEIYAKDLEALESAWNAGVRIYVLSGNRDFSYGKYAQIRFGATALGEGEQITLSDSRPAWLEHGDLLCTSDTSYLRFRKVIRSLPVRIMFKWMPWSMASKMIARIRRKSNEKKKVKSTQMLQIDLTAAKSRLEKKKCQVLLCGHTHQAQAADLGAGRRLLVLQPWCDDPAGYVDDGMSLHPFTA